MILVLIESSSFSINFLMNESFRTVVSPSLQLIFQRDKQTEGSARSGKVPVIARVGFLCWGINIANTNSSIIHICKKLIYYYLISIEIYFLKLFDPENRCIVPCNVWMKSPSNGRSVEWTVPAGNRSRRIYLRWNWNQFSLSYMQSSIILQNRNLYVVLQFHKAVFKIEYPRYLRTVFNLLALYFIL